MKSISKLAATLLILFTVYWSLTDNIPSKKSYPKSLSESGFKVDNALYHLKNISKKSHHVGATEHKEVQNYLVNELEKLGLKTEIQTQAVVNNKWRAGTTVENILTRIKGSEKGKALLLLSHYDSNPHSSLGASDAGSGIVTILETVRAYLEKGSQPKNDIIILFSDAEELGLLGAKAFVEHHPWAKDIGLVLNLEARGSGGSSYMLMETNGKNKTLLTEFLKADPTFPAANSLMYGIYKKLPNDTDLTIFRENADINGFNFAFIDDHYDYHTAQDSYERMDKESLLHQADYLTTALNYFANANLSNLNSSEDYIYTNFPFTKLLIYPFSWVLPMLIIAVLGFLILVFIGLRNSKLTISGIFKGFVPFLVSLILCGGISFGLWKLLLIIHPKYNDILHGFTYNGHLYILAFSLLNLWLLFKIYNRFKNEKTSSLFVAPIIFGLIINFIIYNYLQGAGFLIIPVYFSILILAVQVLMNIKKANQPLLFAIISIPAVYIFAPMVELFPIALGLKILFVAAIIIVILFGLILPVFYQEKQKNSLQFYTGLAAIIIFTMAYFNSDFSVDKKFPNSLVFIQNQDTNEAYWGTYNKNLDDYTKQVFDSNYNEGGIPFAEGKSKYNTRFTYHKKADTISLKKSVISIAKDTILNQLRTIDFTITPSRKVNKFELTTASKINIEKLVVNDALVNNGKPFSSIGTLLIYQMGNEDKEVNISLTLKKEEIPSITLNEISYDLLSNKELNLQPRTQEMMPMPFVTNDAIISSRKLKF